MPQVMPAEPPDASALEGFKEHAVHVVARFNRRLSGLAREHVSAFQAARARSKDFPDRVVCPPNAPSAERFKVVLDAVAAQSLHKLARLLALHADDDGPISYSARPAYCCDPLGAERPKLMGLEVLTNGADDLRTCPCVPCVQHPAQLVATPDERVGLIDQQRGLCNLDGPKQRGRRDIARQERPRAQALQQHQQGRLAATLLRRGDRENGAQLGHLDQPRGCGRRRPTCPHAADLCAGLAWILPSASRP